MNTPNRTSGTSETLLFPFWLFIYIETNFTLILKTAPKNQQRQNTSPLLQRQRHFYN